MFPQQSATNVSSVKPILFQILRDFTEYCINCSTPLTSSFLLFSQYLIPRQYVCPKVITINNFMSKVSRLLCAARKQEIATVVLQYVMMGHFVQTFYICSNMLSVWKSSLNQSWMSGLAFRVGPVRAGFRAGFGLVFLKMFRADFGPACTSFFMQFKVSFSLVKCICCAHGSDFCAWSDYDFSSANFICKLSCVFLFSAWISLTLFYEKASAVRKLARDGFAPKRSTPVSFLACFKKRWPTKGLFIPMALPYIVSFMPIVPSCIMSW